LQQQINMTSTLIECQNSSRPASSNFPRGGFPGESGGFYMFGGQESLIDESIVDSIGSLSGVAAVVPILQHSEGQTQDVTTPYGTRARFVPEYTIVGVPLDSSLINNYPILPTNITQGRNLQTGDTDVVLLSQNNSEYFGAGVSDEVNILGQDLKVVGIYEPSSLTQTIDLYMNITDAQALTNLTGEVSTIDVYAQNSSDVPTIANDISLMSNTPLSINDYQTYESRLNDTQTMYNEALATAQSTIQQTQTTAMQEIVIAVVATSLIVLFVMLYTVRERTKEIGTLKAIGFSNWNVMSQFILEGTLLSFVAGIVGVAIGTVGAPILSGILLPGINVNPFGSSPSSGGFIFRTSAANFGVSHSVAATPSPQLMLIALGAAVLLGALGSLYPAWRASRTRPAEAMRYE
jgi:putative ABC transport system permease protein